MTNSKTFYRDVVDEIYAINPHCVYTTHKQYLELCYLLLMKKLLIVVYYSSPSYTFVGY